MRTATAPGSSGTAAARVDNLLLAPAPSSWKMATTRTTVAPASPVAAVGDEDEGVDQRGTGSSGSDGEVVVFGRSGGGGVNRGTRLAVGLGLRCTKRNERGRGRVCVKETQERINICTPGARPRFLAGPAGSVARHELGADFESWARFSRPCAHNQAGVGVGTSWRLTTQHRYATWP